MPSKKKMRVFISYSHSDKEFVEAIKTLFLKEPVELVYDETVVKLGVKWFDSIYPSIKTSDHLLWLISPASLASNAVSSELFYANIVAQMKKKRAFIWPVIIMKVDNLPDWLKKVVYADFYNQPSEAAIKLLKALKLL